MPHKCNRLAQKATAVFLRRYVPFSEHPSAFTNFLTLPPLSPLSIFVAESHIQNLLSSRIPEKTNPGFVVVALYLVAEPE